MAARKWLRTLVGVLDRDRRARQRQKDNLRTLLKRMSRKEKFLKEIFDSETDADRKTTIAQKIDVLHAQRKKGIDAMKAEKTGS